jgi:hypothetical protein
MFWKNMMLEKNGYIDYLINCPFSGHFLPI